MKAALGLLGGVSLVVLLAGCGKKGPLIYPDLLVPEAPQSVQLEQVAGQLQLSFVLPAKDKAGRRLREQPFQIQVQRRVLAAGERGSCSSCPQDYYPLLRIDPAYPDPAQRAGDRILFVDREVQQGAQYQYRLQAIGKAGESGAVAESVRAVVCSTPPAPQLQAAAMHGGFVLLTIVAALPEDNELVGYAVYRTAGLEPMPTQPMVVSRAARFEDLAVQPGVTYRYAVRQVVRRADDLLSQSDLSTEIAITAAAEGSP